LTSPNWQASGASEARHRHTVIIRVARVAINR
jgi:hypothetical protein